MKINNLKLLASIGLFSVSLAACAAMEDKKEMKEMANDASVSMSVTQLKYSDTGLFGTDKNLDALKIAPAFGNLQSGAHGTFVKMPAGYVSQPHVHTGEYYAVVISGVGVNGLLDSKDIALPVGSYWSQKGGESHVTKCISSSECIFFIGQSVRFDELFNKK